MSEVPRRMTSTYSQWHNSALSPMAAEIKGILDNGDTTYAVANDIVEHLVDTMELPFTSVFPGKLFFREEGDPPQPNPLPPPTNNVGISNTRTYASARSVQVLGLDQLLAAMPLSWEEMGGVPALRYHLRTIEIENLLMSMIEAVQDAEGDAQYYGESEEHYSEFERRLNDLRAMMTRLRSEAKEARKAVED